MPWLMRPALKQLVLCRLREFYREPEALFWVYVFPILMATGLGIAFRTQPPKQVPLGWAVWVEVVVVQATAAPPPPTTVPVPPPSDTADTRITGPSYKVRAGDSLWSIAGRLLGPDASAGRIAREVNRLWQLNEDRIGTGNPSLIHVGTVLKL